MWLGDQGGTRRPVRARRGGRARRLRLRRRAPTRRELRPGARGLRRRVHRRLTRLGDNLRRLPPRPLRPRRSHRLPDRRDDHHVRPALEPPQYAEIHHIGSTAVPGCCPLGCPPAEVAHRCRRIGIFRQATGATCRFGLWSEPAGTSLSPEYPWNMRHDRDILERLADGRRRRLRADGRPVFGLTAQEIEQSTQTAMRLADASKSQAKARASRDASVSA